MNMIMHLGGGAAETRIAVYVCCALMCTWPASTRNRVRASCDLVLCYSMPGTTGCDNHSPGGC